MVNKDTVHAKSDGFGAQLQEFEDLQGHTHTHTLTFHLPTHPRTHARTVLYLNTGSEIPNSAAVSKSMRELVKNGTDQFQEFRRLRLRELKVPLTGRIKRNDILRPKKYGQLSNIKFSSLSIKEDQKLLTELGQVSSVRKEEFIKTLEFEPKNTPQSFVVRGKLYFTNKATLLPRIRSLSPNHQLQHSDGNTQLIVDLSMLITKLQYNKFEHSATFKDFFDLAWNEIVRLLGQCGNQNRLDIVGDNYEEDHLLKGATRSSRGTGTTVEVHPNAVLPNNFGSDFMKSSKNKASLYSAMADYFLEKSEGWLKERRVLVFTKDRNTITLPAEYDPMNDSSHIEADYRLILHI
jgi:hypothetical protein